MTALNFVLTPERAVCLMDSLITTRDETGQLHPYSEEKKYRFIPRLGIAVTGVGRTMFIEILSLALEFCAKQGARNIDDIMRSDVPQMWLRLCRDDKAQAESGGSALCFMFGWSQVEGRMVGLSLWAPDYEMTRMEYKPWHHPPLPDEQLPLIAESAHIIANNGHAFDEAFLAATVLIQNVWDKDQPPAEQVGIGSEVRGWEFKLNENGEPWFYEKTFGLDLSVQDNEPA